MNSDSQTSYWPKMEDDLDLQLLIERVLEVRDRNPRINRSQLSEIIVLQMEQDFREAVQFCPKMIRSESAAGLRGYIEWISNEWKEFKKPSDLCLYMTTNMFVSLFAIHPDLVDGRSLTDLARVLGISKQRMHHRLVKFNEHFGIRGRGQKSETASLAYAQAQMGNNNRVKNRVSPDAPQTEEDIFSQS
jgi:hypothetical protein